MEGDRITLKKLYGLVIQDELEAIDGIEVTKSCFERFLIHASNNGIMEMDRLLFYLSGGLESFYNTSFIREVPVYYDMFQ